MRYKHFTKLDRKELSVLLNKGYSLRDIGRVLKKNPSSISREIQTNSVKGIYDPDKANQKARTKRKESKYLGMKIINNPDLEEYVRNKIASHCTPDQIAGRLREVDQHLLYVSPVSIYKYLYSIYGQSLCKYLPSKRYHRRKRGQKKQRREIIKNRVFIDRRPKTINERKRFGHFEGDVLGTPKSDQKRIIGLVERQSLYLMADQVKQLKYAVDGFNKQLNPYREILGSITLDNGPENARHNELETKTYFCRPYSSWDKPLIENTFGRLRRFIPKKQRIRNLSDEQLQQIVNIMNNTPRRLLSYRTPQEVFEAKRQAKIKSLVKH